MRNLFFHYHYNGLPLNQEAEYPTLLDFFSLFCYPKYNDEHSLGRQSHLRSVTF